MTIRCSGCDGQHSLFNPTDTSQETKKMLRQVLVDLCGPEKSQDVLAGLQLYHTGEIPADTMADLLQDILLADEADRQKFSLPLSEPFDNPHPVTGLMLESSNTDNHGALIPGLLSDMERRAALQIECLHRFPFFHSPCCHQPMCFKCKVMGVHLNQTCDERMRSEMGGDVEVQFCPGCGVPTVRVEGCSSMICVCGESWDWEGDSCDY
eukprot:TRINITY_DN5426_c0_g1_i8.p1 TRINITY_DN5426_c0_g1~~TRINITY_DN5426_c0_g1_i8.p1  ORF type:complete len:209 (-),score=33.88 TRINITY_DN5426_c0_g1_i8:316-942(-)